jgi:hypothetical protein
MANAGILFTVSRHLLVVLDTIIFWLATGDCWLCQA